MKSGELTEHRILSEAGGSAELLVMYDTVWTRYLTEAQSVPPNDMPELNYIVTRMLECLASIRLAFEPPLISLAQTGSSGFRDRIMESFGRLRTPRATRALVLARYDAWGGDAGAADNLRQQLLAVTREETAQLMTKVDTIESGGYAPGDVQNLTKCVIGGALFIVGLVKERWDLVATGYGLIEKNC